MSEATRTSFASLMKRLEERLGHPLPGPEAQLQMAPMHSRASERINVSGRDCREAGVLALLHPMDDVPHVVLTVRRAHLKHHPGQVSFPGGQREGDEPLLQTALREAQEEVDVSPNEVTVLGQLTPLYIPPSGFCVYPFVGFTERVTLTPQDREVERIVHVPFPQLLDPARVREEEWMVRGDRLLVRYFDAEGLRIWGATAMMLSELVAIVKSIDADRH